MTKKQAKSLADALQQKFGGEAEFELVDKPGRYRFAIVSKKFNKLTPLQRQDKAWEIVDGILPRDAVLDISLILTFAPADLVASEK